LARFVLPKCCILGPSPVNHLPQKSMEFLRDLKVKFVLTCFVWLGSAQSAPSRIGLLFGSGFCLSLPTFDSESSVTNFLQASLQREVAGISSLPPVLSSNRPIYSGSCYEAFYHIPSFSGLVSLSKIHTKEENPALHFPEDYKKAILSDHLMFSYDSLYLLNYTR